MKVLVIGSGGREHALVWKLAQNHSIQKIYCAPGNAGIAGLAETVPLQAPDLQGLLSFAKEQRVDLTIVGPELPLTLGIVDLFQKEGFVIFGPNSQAAQLEGSKAWTKALLREEGIPTAYYEVFEDFDRAVDFLNTQAYPVVIKADGLASGKGVVIAADRSEAVSALENMLKKRIFGEAGHRVVIEEFLSGEEASFHVLADGRSLLPLASAQDHKKVGEGDTGLNTGGMGAFSPAPVLTESLQEEVMEKILFPTLRGLQKRGIEYRGVLYAGLMITPQGPKLLEYNVRFGDPETQVMMMRLEDDLADLMQATCLGRLSGRSLHWKKESAVTVVMTASGYPGTVRKGDEIEGLGLATTLPETVVFHSGTKKQGEKIVTDGGRVLSVTSLGMDLRQARNRVYDGCEKIYWPGVYYRRDIGNISRRSK